jgi:hypothetical protein
MKFIIKYTNILIFKLYYYFKDNKAVYLIKEYIKEININELKVKK